MKNLANKPRQKRSRSKENKINQMLIYTYFSPSRLIK